MFRVVIADDENYVIKPLLTSIDWGSLGMRVVKTASNGDDALNYIAHNGADIIITDIRMPGISGLDLCRAVHELNRDLKIIIISGYADFAYAHRAIKYGVIGYCLKPIENDELYGYLKMAVSQIEQRSTIPYQMDILDAIDSGNAELVEEAFIRRGFLEKQFYIAASVGSLDIGQYFGNQRATIKTGVNTYVYLFTQKCDPIQLEKQINGNVRGIGILSMLSDAECIRQDIDRCLSQAYHFFMSSVDAERIKPVICNGLPTSDFAQRTIVSIQKALVSGNMIDAIQYFDSINNSDYEQFFTIKDALQLCNTLYYSVTNSENYYIYNIDQLVKEYGTFEVMLAQIQKLILQTNIDHSMEGISGNINFLNIMKYVNSNYTSDISVKTVAEQLKLNANYVSQLFSKETGTTYSKYLTQLRIIHAKKLLSENRLSLNEVSEQSGFNDYFYFLKVFKKLEGISPGKYRRNL